MRQAEGGRVGAGGSVSHLLGTLHGRGYHSRDFQSRLMDSQEIQNRIHF